MAKVTFTNDGRKSAVVPAGTSILEAAQRCHAWEGSACGGVCACSTCHVWITRGFDLLSEPEDKELDILDKAFDVRPESRLGCQARIEDEDAEIEVTITEESWNTFAAEHPDEEPRHYPGGASR